MQNQEIIEWHEYIRPQMMIVNSLNFVDLNDKDEPLKTTVELEQYGEISHLINHQSTIWIRINEVDIQD